MFARTEIKQQKSRLYMHSLDYEVISRQNDVIPLKYQPSWIRHFGLQVFSKMSENLQFDLKNRKIRMQNL